MIKKMLLLSVILNSCFVFGMEDASYDTKWISLPCEIWLYILVPTAIRDKKEMIQVGETITNFVTSCNNFYQIVKDEEKVALLKSFMIKGIDSELCVDCSDQQRGVWQIYIKELCKEIKQDFLLLRSSIYHPDKEEVIRILKKGYSRSVKLFHTLLPYGFVIGCYPLLQFSSMYYFPELTLWLLDNGTPASDIEQVYSNNAYVDKELIKTLVEKGMDPNGLLAPAISLLRYAIDEQDGDLVQFLLEHGGDKDKESSYKREKIEKQNDSPVIITYFECYSPLSYAKEFGTPEMFELLNNWNSQKQ